jgi:hypothetical protein
MIRSVSRFVLLTACCAAPVAAHAQVPWRQVYKDADVTVILDTASVILQSPGTWNTITSWDYRRPRITENKKTYTRLVERAYVKCAPVRIKRVRSTVYVANNILVRDEGEVDPRDQAHMVWDRPRAGTVGRNAFESVCGILAGKAAGRGASGDAQKSAPAASKKTPVRKPPPKR